MKTRIIKTPQGLSDLESSWNNLLENSKFRDLGYSYKWFHNWTSSFLEDKPMSLVAIERDDKLLSVMPLYKEKIPYLKMKIPALKSMTNWHSHRFDMLAQDDNGELFSKTISTAFSEGNEQMIVLNFVPSDSYIFKWVDSVCKEMNWKFKISEHSTNCQVKEANNFAEYFEQLDSKFRRNVRAAEKKAKSIGELGLKQLKNEDDLSSFLEKGFAIEASGWKGSQGTAIACNTSVKRFYEGIARDFFKQGKFEAYLFGNEKDDLAFLYCIKGFGVTRALKIGSNENFRNLAPGMLITKEVLSHLHNTGNFNVWDFCGGEARWKNDWGNIKEKLYNVVIYKNSLMGKLLYKLGS